MKISLEIPERLDGLLQLVSNGELIAHKQPEWDYWLVKETHCNRCGECCMDFPPSPFGCDEEGKCNMLIPRRGGGWKCKKFNDRPMRCVGDPVNLEELGCSITYKKVPIV